MTVPPGDTLTVYDFSPTRIVANAPAGAGSIPEGAGVGDCEVAATGNDDVATAEGDAGTVCWGLSTKRVAIPTARAPINRNSFFMFLLGKLQPPDDRTNPRGYYRCGTVEESHLTSTKWPWGYCSPMRLEHNC